MREDTVIRHGVMDQRSEFDPNLNWPITTILPPNRMSADLSIIGRLVSASRLHSAVVTKATRFHWRLLPRQPLSRRLPAHPLFFQFRGLRSAVQFPNPIFASATGRPCPAPPPNKHASLLHLQRTGSRRFSASSHRI